MGIKPTQYSNFTMFIKRVLDVAVAEINDKTDIAVSYSLEKLGRQTIGLCFQMKPKEKARALDLTQQAVQEQLLFFGLSKEQAEDLVQKHDTGYLEANIEIVREQVAKGEVQNVRAYLLKALQVDFREQANEHTKQLAAAAKAQEAERMQKQAAAEELEGLKSDFEQERRESLVLAIQSLGTEKTALLQAAFLDTLKPIFQKYYQKGGLEHIMIQAQRVHYASKELLAKQYHSQDNYIAFRKTESK
jgi:plasmid replication initiation protein